MTKIIALSYFTVLLLLTPKTNAAPVPGFDLNDSPGADSLKERLIMDNHFRDLSTSAYTLITKIQESKTGRLFRKYFEKTISREELSILINGAGFSSKDDFVAYLKEMYLNKLQVNRKFPELNTDINSAKSVIEAGKQVVADELKPTHTAGQCWALFLSASSACIQGCAYWEPGNWETCMELCMSVVISGSSLCFLLAE